MADFQPLDRLPGRQGEQRRLGDDSGDWTLHSKTTVEHQIAEVLREKIIVGSIARGQKLKQAEIARMLGVSITPVREALRLLEAQGYVAATAHRGAVVAPFVIEGAEELYQLRQDALKALNHDLLAAVRSRTRSSLQEKNFRFHFRFYELANQPQTIGFVRVLWAKYPLDLLSKMPGRPMRVFEEHAALLEALERGDPAGAVAAMEHHIKVGWDEFRANYQASEAARGERA
jgi:DNA-binding GntR family transcriptional regulator